MTIDGEQTLRSLGVDGVDYDYYSLAAAEQLGLSGISRLPYTLKIVLENLLRQQAMGTASSEDVVAIAAWLEHRRSDREIGFKPTRVLMPDSTGVPFLGDMAAMRDALHVLGGDPESINPVIPVDLVVDHSVGADHFGHSDALAHNTDLEFAQNRERYEFLRWAGQAFGNLRLVPPGMGICHQINVEHFGRVVCVQKHGDRHLAIPDSLVGMDSHTAMINGLGIVGWGVGGLEGGTAALGEPVSMLIPEVVGCHLYGRLPAGVTATDLVLTITQTLRGEKLVGQFVEYFGAGLDTLGLTDRTTIANMTPEFGATVGFFPVDAETLRFLAATGRDPDLVALIRAYCQAQGLWRDADTPPPSFSRVIKIDLDAIEPCVSGPSFPHERVRLADAPAAFGTLYPQPATRRSPAQPDLPLRHGDIVIAAITSCTNTSNPASMITAGLLARNAVRLGLKTRPWIKTTLSPGSGVVASYLTDSGLQLSFDLLGFRVVGFGCMTCMGNSGPLPAAVSRAIEQDDLAVAAVLSGNRNFEGRIHGSVKANFLASPPLVVAYALAGTILADLTRDPVGKSSDGAPVYLRDIWPDATEVGAIVEKSLRPALFTAFYHDVVTGPPAWENLPVTKGTTFPWQVQSTFIRRPPFFDGMTKMPEPTLDIRGARILGMFGDMITTDHISPIGPIPAKTPAGHYLESLDIAPPDFVTYAARRLNHDVMARGTFANPRIRNELTPGREGSFTRHQPDGNIMSFFDAAECYRDAGVPLVVIAGRDYGAGSSRDWAAKGARLLGIRAVLAESFERIHRSNLIGMGILPLQFMPSETRKTLDLDGSETIDVIGLENSFQPFARLDCTITRSDGRTDAVTLLCRLDTRKEIEYYRQGGILNYAVRAKLHAAGEAGQATL